MTRLTRISYIFMVVLLLVVGGLHLATPLITVLFAYFALNKLDFMRRKWVAVVLFMILVSAIFYGFYAFVKHAVVALPDIVNTAIPKIIDYAQKHDIELPFYDLQSLKVVALEGVKDQLNYLGNFAKFATKEFVALVIGLVVACSMFLSAKVELGRETNMFRNNLYSLVCDEIVLRFRSFYESFAMVMGAQIIISTINTLFTAIFVVAVRLPYAAVVIVLTFLCGLLPIVGNIISNTIIVGIAFTRSPNTALALAFLVVVHKLEYFLNSKIIGDRIKNPVWLTLLALVLGERLMGIPGMILAPVILHYVKVEMSKIRVDEVRPTDDAGHPPAPHIAVGK
jgi:predicted PurR-regulated permease PerM